MACYLVDPSWCWWGHGDWVSYYFLLFSIREWGHWKSRPGWGVDSHTCPQGITEGLSRCPKRTWNICPSGEEETWVLSLGSSESDTDDLLTPIPLRSRLVLSIDWPPFYLPACLQFQDCELLGEKRYGLWAEGKGPGKASQASPLLGRVNETSSLDFQ